MIPVDVMQQECSAELEKYLTDRITFKDKFDVFLYWKDEGKMKYPNVSRLTRKALACPASSVVSERLFSKAGLIYEDRRSRLLPVKCEKLLFLSKNLAHYTL